MPQNTTPTDPKCGSGDVKLLKSWQIKPKQAYAEERGIHHVLEISLWFCKNCGHRFRTTHKLEA
jgi:hypothetical protein